MEAIWGSYSEFFTCKQRLALWSREIALGRQETGFLALQRRLRCGFPLAVSFRHKCIRSISAASSAQANSESEEIQTIRSDQPKTVRVKFKLHKECAFGQHFLIVGDDPVFGLWDPSDGAPLDWSDGHVWTAEVDVPSGKLIKYKFILKANSGVILWQPGPDRILETWDTEKTIRVCEDWDNPQLQNIVEEELVGDLNEECVVNSDLLVVAEVAENLNAEILDEGTDFIKEATNTSDHTNHVKKPSAAMVAENVAKEMGEQDLSSSDKGSDLMSLTDPSEYDDGRTINGSNLLSTDDDTSPVSDEVVPVLVPGLAPMPPEENEEAELDQVENNNVDNTPIGSDETEEDLTDPKLKDEQASASLHHTESSETVINEQQQQQTVINEQQQQSHGIEQPETINEQQQQSHGIEQPETVLETDMQWGRQTLQKILASFGLQ